MEKRVESPLPIIGNSAFGLTRTDVVAAIRESQEQVAIASFDFVETWQRRHNALREIGPHAILRKLRGVYNRTKYLAESGLDEFSIARAVRDEFPDFTDYYTLARRRTWGYTLGQAVVLVKALDKTKGKS